VPTLPEILHQLQFIKADAILLGLLMTAGTILIARDWRLLLVALLAQYLLIGILLARLVRPDIAVLNVLIGAFICPILYLSARQVAVNSLSVYAVPQDTSSRKWWSLPVIKSFLVGADRTRGLAPTGTTFRIFVTLLMILVTLSVSNSFPLPNLRPSITIAVYWLVLAGLVTLTLTENPLKAGHGLLTALMGFGLFYVTLESSLLLTGMWGTVNLLIALAIGYLVVVKGAASEEEI
jgi:hypothetical protein